MEMTGVKARGFYIAFWRIPPDGIAIGPRLDLTLFGFRLYESEAFGSRGWAKRPCSVQITIPFWSVYAMGALAVVGAARQLRTRPTKQRSNELMEKANGTGIK